jgi:uncharacterized repeat protein (TIGR03803 family)
MSPDGNLYVCAEDGGANGLGTILRIGLDGSFNTLYQFSGSDGANPWGGLVQGLDGLFYGTTSAGGDYDNGTVFTIDTAGNLHTLKSFHEPS